jgi:hypothetical protein
MESLPKPRRPRPVPARRPSASRNRRRPALNRSPAPMLLLALFVFSVAFYYERNQAADTQSQPESSAAALQAQSEGELRTLLPAGARLLQSIPLRGGAYAIAWQAGQAARTGVARPRSGGGFTLWTAATPTRADLAGEASVAVTELPGLAEPVLVSSYQTDGCCAWVNLFVLSDPPRLLFASPTTSSRFLAGHVVVQKRLPGTYPDGSASDTDVYSWNGREFSLSGATLAPQHYFPLGAQMRWRYQAGSQVVERWVQEGRQADGEIHYLVRSVAHKNGRLSSLPDAIYAYGPEGQVRRLSPEPELLLSGSPAEGASWEAAADLTARAVAVKPSLTVKAGTFRDVLVVEAGGVRRFYAPQVGLIREERGDEPALELISYSKQ